MITNDELLNALREEIDRAVDDERAEMREKAAAYFFGELPEPPEDLREVGFSDIVSTDVGDGVESVMAELMPSFTAYPVRFEPTHPGDELAADLESRAVHQEFINAGGYIALAQAVKSALLMRAGVIKVSWDVRKVPVYQRFEQTPVEELQISDDLLEAEIDDDGYTASGMTRSYRMEAKARVDAIPLSEFLIDKDTMPGRLDEARYIGQRRTLTRGELVSMGFDIDLVEDLKAWDAEREASHKSTELIMCVDSYYRIDADDDGIAELRRIITGGGTEGYDEVLWNEPVQSAPFAVGLGYLGLFTWDGVSLYDKLREVQDIKSSQIRDLQDYMRRASRQRVGVVEYDANVDDLLTSVRGGVVRCKTPTGVFPLTDATLPAGSFEFLGYMDKLRRDKGGGAIDSAQQALQIGGESAHGVERIMSSIEQINALVARTMAETLLKPAYSLLHGILRENRMGALQVSGASGWEQTEPAMWQPRDKLVLTLGMSSAERQRRLVALGAVIQQQTKALESGLTGQLVDLNGVYRALIDAGRMAELDAPESYFINPATPQAQQAAQQQAQQAQQDKQEQQQLAMMQYQILPQVEQIKAQNKVQIQQMQGMIDSMKAALKHNIDTLNARIKLLDIEAKVDPVGADEDIDEMQGEEREDGMEDRT